MTTVRKTCTWIFVLLLIAVAGGGGYAYWFLSHSDELVRAALLEKMVAAAPDWDVAIPEARIDLWGRVRVYDLTLKDPERREPTVSLPETIVILDRGRLADQEIIIQQVRLLRPQLELVRDRAGKWNLEGIKPPEPANSQPEIFVENGALTIRVTHEDGRLSPAVTLRDVNLELTPTGKKRYRVTTNFQLDKAGKIDVHGEFDLDAQTWEAGGAIRGLSLDETLFRELAGFFPQQVRQLEGQVDLLLASERLTTAPLPEAASPQTPGSFEAAVDRILRVAQFSATTDIAFQAKQWQPDAPLQYGAKIALTNGRLQGVFLPFELLDLQGEIFVNNSRISVQQLTARNGNTALHVDGSWALVEGDAPPKIGITITDLPVDLRLRSRLPASWQKYYDDTRPRGRIDVAANLMFDRLNGWTYGSVVTIKDGAAQHVKFPYPISGLSGQVVQEGPQLTAELRGLAGDRPLSLTADVRHPGPLAESTVKIHVDKLPIDTKLINACPPPARKAIQQRSLRGTIDADVTLYRPPGEGHKHRPYLVGELRNCAMTYANFPYELKNLSGHLTWDAEDWTFKEMTATHGVAQVAAQGYFLKRNGGQLEMNLIGRNGSFESEELYYALPEPMQRLVDEFDPKGRFDIATRIAWTPGTVPLVDINRLDLKQASIKLRSFPFPFYDLSGSVSVTNDPQRDQRNITLERLTGKHGDDKYIELRGGGEYYQDGEWHISFEDLKVDDLDTGNRFRKALPKALRAFFESTDPRGTPISAAGRLALRGTPGQRETAVTASWDIDIHHAGTTITAGVDLENLHGRVNLKGSWDNEVIQGTGWLDIQSVIINGYQITDIAGPMLFQNDQFIIGSADVASNLQDAKGPRAPDDSERVTAKFIGGKLVLDGIATLDEKNGYLIQVQMQDGYVEKYTERYAPKQKKLRGRVNGIVVFDGSGSDPNSFRGRGKISINPAALYELPVILAMTKTLSFLPPDKTAFDRAEVVFESSRHEYLFRQSDLMGDAISLRGRGRMLISDGRLDLEFYSTVPRNELPVPIVGKLVNGLVDGWIQVKVTGTTSDPRVTEGIVPRLDNSVRSLLGVLNPQPPPRRPSNAPPPPAPPRR